MYKRGFTIVEIIVVVLVIGILVGITIFAIGGWRTRTAETEVKNELLTAQSAIGAYRTFSNANPANLAATTYSSSAKVTLTYTLRGNGTFCLVGVSSAVSSVQMYVESANEVPTSGACS